MTKAIVNDWYGVTLKAWQVKLYGPKPTLEMLAKVQKLGLRAGKQAMVNAMYLRDGGATSPQVVMVCGAPQLNKMRDLVADALVKRDMSVGKTAEGHQIYKLTLTPKGNQRIERADKAAAALEAAGKGDAVAAPKAKRVSKPRKPKVTVTHG